MPEFYKRDCGNSEANRKYLIEQGSTVFYVQTNKTHSKVYRFGEVLGKEDIDYGEEVNKLPEELKSELPTKLEGEEGTIVLK